MYVFNVDDSFIIKCHVWCNDYINYDFYLKQSLDEKFFGQPVIVVNQYYEPHRISLKNKLKKIWRTITNQKDLEGSELNALILDKNQIIELRDYFNKCLDKIDKNGNK